MASGSFFLFPLLNIKSKVMGCPEVVQVFFFSYFDVSFRIVYPEYNQATEKKVSGPRAK